MIKSVIAGAVAMAVVSSGVNTAPTIPQGRGRVAFNGTVVDAPCSISQRSADQSIDFGQLSKSFLTNDGQSKPVNLDTELVNYDITAFKNGDVETRNIKLAFIGPTVSDHPSELAASGGTSTAIMIQTAGENIPFNGTEDDTNLLKDGDNILHYTTVVKRSSDGNAQITEGAFSAVTASSLSYQQSI